MLDVKNSTDYEKVAQEVYQAFLATDQVQTIEVQHNVQIKGRSGVAHQIDVYWRYLEDGAEHQVLVECKHYKSAIDLIHARNLLGLLTDIPNSQGVLLTTVGFQSGVVSLCNFYGISLKRLRGPQGSDWDGFVQSLDINATFNRTQYVAISFTADGKDPETIASVAGASTFQLDAMETLIQEGTDTPVALNRWLDRNVPFDEDQIDVPLTARLMPPDTFFILESGQRVKIRRLDIEYMHSSMTHSLSFDAMDLVRGVLEDFNTKAIDHTLYRQP